MPHPAESFTFMRWISQVVTVTATPATIRSLIEARVAEVGADISMVQQIIIHHKIAAGSDRAAIRCGEDASHMSITYAAGEPADPPGRGIDWFIERVGGSDFPATIMIGLFG